MCSFLMKSIKRLDNIDLFKCIAILMVVSIHINVWHTYYIEQSLNDDRIQYAIRLIMEGVPIFLFVNGFLTMDKEFDLKKHLKKTFKLFLLYVFWAVTTYLLCSLFLDKTITIKGIWDSIILTRINTLYTGHLWFIQNLIAVYMIVPIIKPLYLDEDKYYLYRYLFIMVTLFTFVPAFINLCGGNKISEFILLFNPVTNLNYLFYFMLGSVVKKNIKEFEKNRKTFIIFGILSYIGAIILGFSLSKSLGLTYKPNYLYEQVLLVPIILGMFALIYNYKSKDRIYNYIITSLSNNTFGIYVIHYILIYLSLSLKYHGLINKKPFIHRFGYFIIIFVLSFIISLIISKIPKVKNIIKP